MSRVIALDGADSCAAERNFVCEEGSSPLPGIIFVRLIEDRQLVGIFHRVSRAWLESWADTVANADLCEYATIDHLVMVWPDVTSQIPYPDRLGEAGAADVLEGYPGAVFETPTERALKNAVWHPLAPGDFVYFAAAGDRVKIGKASNVDSRIATLQTGCPYRIRLLKVERGGHDLERAYHARFSHLRETGEWFRHEAELAAFLTGGA